MTECNKKEVWARSNAAGRNKAGRKINVVMVLPDLGPHATGRLVTSLPSSRYKVTVIGINPTWGVDSVFEKSGYQMITLRKNGVQFIRPLVRLYQLLIQFKPDILIGSLFHANILTRGARFLLPRALIVNFEVNTMLGQRWRILLNRISTFLADCVIANSSYVKQVVLRELKPGAKKVYELPTAIIKVSDFSLAEPLRDSSKIVIGTLGFLKSQKGYADLIYAAHLLKPRVGCSFEVWIVGDGSLRDELKDLAEQLGVSPIIKFLGFRKDIRELLPKMDIYVQPSLYEGFCTAVTEAMASGLPIVASDVGGIKDIITQGETGYLTEAQNPQSLYEKIRYLMENPQIAKALGKNARKYAETNLTLKSTVYKFERLLEGLVENRY
jgi:glycosyltransferase involved in cell wall biosynthesis